MARARVTSLVIEAIVDLVLQCSWLVAHVTTDCPFFKRVEGWVKKRRSAEAGHEGVCQASTRHAFVLSHSVTQIIAVDVDLSCRLCRTTCASEP